MSDDIGIHFKWFQMSISQKFKTKNPCRFLREFWWFFAMFGNFSPQIRFNDLKCGFREQFSTKIRTPNSWKGKKRLKSCREGLVSVFGA